MKNSKALAPRLNPQVAPRERRMDHNTVSRPRRAKASAVADGPPETMAQFEARGGRVQRLTTSWEQAA